MKSNNFAKIPFKCDHLNMRFKKMVVDILDGGDEEIIHSFPM